MRKDELLKKIGTILDDLVRTRAWGTIEVEVREGVPNMIRRSINEKLIAQENNRGSQYRTSF